MRRTLALIALNHQSYGGRRGNCFEDLIEWVTGMFGPHIEPGGEPNFGSAGPFGVAYLP